MELISEAAVLGIIDEWWRRDPVSPAPLKAAQISIRLGLQRHVVDVPLLVPHVVGLIRDLARRGFVRALPDGSAVLSYLAAPAAAPDRWSAPAPVASTWGTVGTEAAVAGRPPSPVPRVAPRAGLPGLGRPERLVLRVVLVLFILMTTGVVVALDRLIDIPARTHGVMYCGDSGQVGSTLPRCDGAGGR